MTTARLYPMLNWAVLQELANRMPRSGGRSSPRFTVAGRLHAELAR